MQTLRGNSTCYVTTPSSFAVSGRKKPQTHSPRSDPQTTAFPPPLTPCDPALPKHCNRPGANCPANPAMPGRQRLPHRPDPEKRAFWRILASWAGASSQTLGGVDLDALVLATSGETSCSNIICLKASETQPLPDPILAQHLCGPGWQQQRHLATAAASQALREPELRQ